MNIQDFDTYRVEELTDILIDGINPESMTVPYDKSLVKQSRFKKHLLNDNQVFIVSTQKKKPLFHFKQGQSVDIQGPFFENSAECFALTEFIHKGFRMTGYLFQFK